MDAPLEVDDLTVDFGGLRALGGVSLVVPPSTTVGLIGPNGAGKTTLFDAVVGTVSPTSGAVRLFGRDVSDWPLHRRMKLGVGRTFQRLELFGSLTVTENVIVALEAAHGVGNVLGEMLRRPSSIDVRRRAEGRAAELLDLVGLLEHASTRAGDLPVGLARICELAQALAADPRLLLLDEPSSGLSEEESARLAELIGSMSAERSFLVVEHDMGFVLPLSSEVYVLDFGTVIAHGTPEAIRSDPIVQAAYLGAEIPDARG